MHNLAVISNIDSSLSLVYCNETNRLKQGDVQSIWTGIPKNAPGYTCFFLHFTLFDFNGLLYSSLKLVNTFNSSYCNVIKSRACLLYYIFHVM